MKLPLPLFQRGIQAGKIYYFSSDKIETPIPHYFICLAKNDSDIVFLACCTSQFEKKEKRINRLNLPYSTLVYVRPTQENGLSVQTFVDCNNPPFEYTIEQLCTKYEEGNLDFAGQVTDDILEQIKKGLLDSPLIEEELKETISKLIP